MIFNAAIGGLTVHKANAVPPNMANITFLDTSAGNVCLDGSAPAYYYRQEAETKKVYLHQQGGGWCESDDDCLSRAGTPLGSSKTYAQSINLGGGYFSNDPSQSPLMYNFSKVFLPYCDGSSQTSDLSDPVTVGKSTIYYRGHRILISMIQKLTSPGGPLYGIEQLVVSGCSAGGLSTFLHADEWAAALPGVQVVAMPDSGFFLDYNTTTPGKTGYGTALRWVYNRMNGTGGVPAACRAANPNDEAKCIFAEHVAPTLKTPFFPLQSQYDSWQVGNDLMNNTAAAVNTYGQLLSQRVQTDLLAANPNHGVFLDSCYHHCGDEWDAISIDGQKQSAAFQQWYTTLGVNGAKKFWNQNQVYPCNSCCS